MEGLLLAVRAPASGLAASPARRQLLVDYLTGFVAAQRGRSPSPGMATALAALVERVDGAPPAARLELELALADDELRVELRMREGIPL